MSPRRTGGAFSEDCYARHANSENENVGIFRVEGEVGSGFVGQPVLVVPDDPPSRVEALLLLDEGTVDWLLMELGKLKAASGRAKSETRPLIVDDEWIDDGGELNRCERIYGDGDKILLSFDDPDGGWKRIYEGHLAAFVVGQKRADGSIIGPPEVES